MRKVPQEKKGPRGKSTNIFHNWGREKKSIRENRNVY